MARETQSSVIERIAARSGFTEFGYIPVSGLRFSEDIRKICEGNSCRNYGTSWACPPAVGTLEECRRRVGQYDTMLLFTKKYELESSFDFEAMGAGLGDFKKAVDRFHKALDPVLPEFLLMSNEGCGRCAKCTWPDAPCRFPEKQLSSMEGYGMVVNEVCMKNNIPYNYGRDTMTYVGCALFE